MSILIICIVFILLLIAVGLLTNKITWDRALVFALVLAMVVVVSLVLFGNLHHG